MKKLYDDVDWSCKKAGERLTTGLLEEMCVKYRQNGDFEIRNPVV
jgi:hypothetical protein